ncbi:MAG: hypothetical protein K2N53_02270 [Clostridia bacterium]|nr:hypothetical protein [Clostridia bacterium]
MKFKSKQTIIFSILTLLCIALIIFVLCLPMGIPSLSEPISMSQKIEIKNVDRVPKLCGKIKNKTDDDVYLSGQCITITLDGPIAGGVRLHVSVEDTIVIEAGREFDLSSVEAQIDEYDYLASHYALENTFALKRVVVDLNNYGPAAFCIYDRELKEEGETYATVIAIFALAFALTAAYPLIVYVRSKKRLALAQAALAKIPDGVFLRGALCRKKRGEIKATALSKIKGNFKSPALGVNIRTVYQSAEAMDFVLTPQGFYIASAKSKTLNVSEMEFFDKEELDKTQIVTIGKNVVLNPLFNDNYFAFDLTFSKTSFAQAEKLLSKMFDEVDEIQNAYFDENAVQKNI